MRGLELRYSPISLYQDICAYLLYCIVITASLVLSLLIAQSGPPGAYETLRQTTFRYMPTRPPASIPFCGSSNGLTIAREEQDGWTNDQMVFLERREASLHSLFYYFHFFFPTLLT